MEFKDIEYVCAIAEHKSITKAARALFITQPTLSQYIKNMQERLGVKLFRYEGNRIFLTYEGEIFVREGQRLIRDRDTLINSIHSLSHKGRGRLRIAVPLGRGSRFLPDILPRFKKLYPHAEIVLSEGSSRELIELVRGGYCDLVLTNSVNPPGTDKPVVPSEGYVSTQQAGIESEVVGHEQMRLVIGKDLPWASYVTMDQNHQPHIDLTTCREAPFVLHRPYQFTGDVERRLLKHAGFKPHVVLETKNLNASYMLAVRGYGLTFLSEYHISYMDQGYGACHCLLDDPLADMQIIIGYKQHSNLSFLAQEFVRMTKELLSPQPESKPAPSFEPTSRDEYE